MATDFNRQEVTRAAVGQVRRAVLRALAAGTQRAKLECVFGHGFVTGTYQRSIGFDQTTPARFIFGSFGGRHNAGESVAYAADVNAAQHQIDNGWAQVETSLETEIRRSGQ